MYSIFKELYLDRLLKKYETVLIVSPAPNLNYMTRNIRLEKVSVHKPILIVVSPSKVLST